MIEKIEISEVCYAIIIRASYQNSGIKFFTKDSDSQQLGYMKRPKDYIIEPHRHNLIPREVNLTQEVLFVKTGKVRVDFFTNSQTYLYSKLLYKGDVILLCNGGHGFQMLEDSELIEVKQGPYCGKEDKIRFDSINENKIIYK